MPKSIIKRDGRIKPFNLYKIKDAVKAAYKDVYGDEERFEEEWLSILSLIAGDLDNIESDSIEIEKIQDIVVENLKKVNIEIANAYQEYREERTFERECKSELDKEIDNVINNISEESTANANVDGSKIQSIRAIITNIVCRAYSRRRYIPKRFRKKQKKEIYIHDEYYFGLPFWNCNNTNWPKMFREGFELGSTTIESPKSLKTAVNVLTQVASHISSNTYGGTSFPNMIKELTPYAKLSLEKYRVIANSYVKDELKEDFAWFMLRREMKNVAQSMEYEIQTLMTSRGETPFLTLGIDCIDLNSDEETQRIQVIITKAILQQRIDGLTGGITPVFPKLVYQLKKGNNLEKNDPYYDLFKMAVKCSALRGYPKKIGA